ncbi:hypothetical protein LZ30DRAFT_814150 [Colletotrichum cereale]|nr:hypothetical protein LZ30DRAFT_814150 [Colletotrichum cereale]
MPVMIPKYIHDVGAKGWATGIKLRSPENGWKGTRFSAMALVDRSSGWQVVEWALVGLDAFFAVRGTFVTTENERQERSVDMNEWWTKAIRERSDNPSLIEGGQQLNHSAALVGIMKSVLSTNPKLAGAQCSPAPVQGGSWAPTKLLPKYLVEQRRGGSTSLLLLAAAYSPPTCDATPDWIGTELAAYWNRLDGARLNSTMREHRPEELGL